eukprot:gene2161-biopygen9484
MPDTFFADVPTQVVPKIVHQNQTYREKRLRTRPGRVPDASHAMTFEETDASRTRPEPFPPGGGGSPSDGVSLATTTFWAAGKGVSLATTIFGATAEGGDRGNFAQAGIVGESGPSPPVARRGSPSDWVSLATPPKRIRPSAEGKNARRPHLY